MVLPSNLVTKFVRTTNDTKKPKSESTVYGTIVYDGKPYVKLDGSELLTPITSTTTNVEDGERVTVTIKDHTATVTGNISSPAARGKEVEELGGKIQEFENIIADSVTTEMLEAEIARIDKLVADNVTIRGELQATQGVISELEADNVDIKERLTASEASIGSLEATKLDADIANLTYATIEELDAVNIEVNNLEATYGEFQQATIVRLNVLETNTKDLDAKYATIDFANIGEAAIEKLFSDSGIIESLVMSDGKVTGELIGVSISGDLIKGNTIQAEKLIVKGEDGLYHRLNVDGGVTTTETLTEEDLQNGLHGSVIIAKSVTAEKVAVDDLVAFDATIGGFQITEDSIHSEAKDSVSNTTPGIYLDRDGQFAIGDGDNYIKYFKDIDDAYKLMIAAESITMQIKNATEALEQTVYNVNKHFSFDDNGLTIKAGENAMSIRVDNDIVVFEKNGVQFGWWDGINFHTGNIMIEVNDRAQFGNFAYIPRSDGSLSFLKVEHKTGFYAIVNGGIMSIYGAYPTLEDNTMIISDDIPGELSGTTLVLNGGQ